LDLGLYFGLHKVEEFNSTFDRLFSVADVVVAEYAVTEYAGETEDVYNKLSTGKVTPEYAMIHISNASYSRGELSPIGQAFDKAIFEKIANCCKRIYVERSPLTLAEFRGFDSAWRPPDKNVRDEGYVADYLRAYAIYLRSLATRLKVRDMQHALQIAGLSRKHPESCILVLRGATHRFTLETFLREQDLRFTSHLCDARVRCMLASELIQKLALGLRVGTRELLMSAVQSFDLERSCDGLTMDNVAMTYKVVTTMSDSELESRLQLHSSAI